MFHKSPMGFMLDFPNGWTASVQFGPGNYCSNRDMKANPFRDEIKFIESGTAEIAAWITDLRTTSTTRGWYKFEDGQEVNGWQNVNSVMEFLNMVASFRDEDDIPLHSLNQFMDLIDPFGNHMKELEVANYV